MVCCKHRAAAVHGALPAGIIYHVLKLIRLTTCQTKLQNLLDSDLPLHLQLRRCDDLQVIACIHVDLCIQQLIQARVVAPHS